MMRSPMIIMMMTMMENLTKERCWGNVKENPRNRKNSITCKGNDGKNKNINSKYAYTHERTY